MRGRINYYVLAVILLLTLIYVYLNSLEPDIPEQLDFSELIFMLAYSSATVFAFIVAKRYRGSKVFGRAYLSLAVAYMMNTIGVILFTVLQIMGTANPFPDMPDFFFSLYYPLAIIHLMLNIRFVKGGLWLQKGQRLTLVLLPGGVVTIYIIGMLAPISVDIEQLNQQPHDNIINLIPFVSHIKINEPMSHDADFYRGFYAGIWYVIATTSVFSWAIIGAQIFRNTKIGAPWGLLLVGIGLNAVGDVSYYLTGIYTFDRTTPIICIWVLGLMIISYALHLHRKQI